MSKRIQKYMKMSFVHPIKTKKQLNLATLLSDYTSMWIELNGHKNDFTQSYHDDGKTRFVTVIIPKEAQESVSYLWYKAIYFLWPNASMWGEPCDKDGNITYA